MTTFMRRAMLVIACAVFVGKALQSVDPEVRRGWVRQFNKHVLNPLALRLAARRWMYYGVVRHTGRRSGKVYSTPLVARLTPDGVIIPLTYGPQTDWCRNVLAAGGATLRLHGDEYALSAPEVVPASAAVPLLAPVNAAVWRRLGVQHYLLMHRAAMEQAVPAAA